MIGAIAGDIVGSVYEYTNEKRYDFPLFQGRSEFTDDSVLTIAIADALLEADRKKDYRNTERYYKAKLREYGRKYPDAGYGESFYTWLFSDDPQPYNSYGNGSAMRVSAVSYVFNNIDSVLREAEKQAAVTHNHPEGIKGAQAAAAAVFLARKRRSKQEIRQFVESTFDYSLDFDLEDLHDAYVYEISCQKTVPESIFVFLESAGFEDAIRKAIYIGGDADTVACITGSIAFAFYSGAGRAIEREIFKRLNPEMRNVIKRFANRFCPDIWPASWS